MRCIVQAAGAAISVSLMPAFGVAECRPYPQKGLLAMVWLLVSLTYFAPASATDWKGPWRLGPPDISNEAFTSEAECQKYATQGIDKMHHDGFRVPMRFRCVGVDAKLPAGAPL